MQRRRSRMPDQHDPLGPEDDPYLAYLIWREERDAVARAGQPEAVVAGPSRGSWVRRLAVWRRADSGDPDR